MDENTMMSNEEIEEVEELDNEVEETSNGSNTGVFLVGMACGALVTGGVKLVARGVKKGVSLIKDKRQERKSKKSKTDKVEVIDAEIISEQEDPDDKNQK
jgi:uncharacterized protein (DUF2062 family)